MRVVVVFVSGVLLSLVVVVAALLWPHAGSSPTRAQGTASGTGDCDGDGKINLTDAIWLLRYIFIPGAPEPVACADGPGLTPEQAEILSYFSIGELDDGRGGRVKTIRIARANLQIVNGRGATNGNSTDPETVDPAQAVTNGVGNLIVGYQELRNDGTDNRLGSHNIVVGRRNNYSGFGGLVIGLSNEAAVPYACVSAGRKNAPRWPYDSVGGADGVERFKDHGDGTVTDTWTGLMWQQDAADMNGDGTADSDDIAGWYMAVMHCRDSEFAGYTNWRLPTLEELQSIVDPSRADPAIYPVFRIIGTEYWTSSMMLNNPSYGCLVDFYDGSYIDREKIAKKTYVRAVRDAW